MSKKARDVKSAKTHEALEKLTGIGKTEKNANDTGESKVKSTDGSTSKTSGGGKVKSADESKSKSSRGSKVKSASESKSKSEGESKAKSDGGKKAGSKKDSKADQPEEIKLERQPQTNKTPMVLKLLEQDKGSSNPVILAGKSRIPRQLSGRAPLSKILKRGMGEEFSEIEGTVVVNITQMAIEFLAPEILDRFNACSCDKCVEEFSHIVAERVPVRFARISKGSQYRGSHELTERMEPARRMVLSEMIKELIGNKKRCFHDE